MTENHQEELVLEAPRPESEPYIECESRLHQLHQLIRDGAGDSTEAEELRDEMDVFWYQLNSDERDRLGQRSLQLNKHNLD
jgi:hypothetical protein